jgi:Ca-activated chloride channel family protein
MFKCSFLACILTSLSVLAQQPVKPIPLNGSLTGKVTDAGTAEEVPFANLLITGKDSTVKYAVVSDLEGNYSFKQVKPGNYNISVKYVGYSDYSVKGIIINPGKNTVLDIKLPAAVHRLDEVTITEYAPKAAEAEVKSMSVITRQEYKSVPAKNINQVAGTTSGVYRKKDGRVRGGRTGTEVYGMKEDYNREGYNRIYDNEFKDSKHDPLSTFSIDVDRASYSNVRRFLNQHSLPQADVVRIEEMINYFSYKYPQPKADDPFSITTEYTECPWNKKHSLIHIGLQGKEVKLDNLPANNLTFLIDVSGSMSSGDKLPLLKSGLRLLVEQMRPEDKVSLVVYAGAAGVVLPPTSGNHKDRILDALDKLESGGSTAGGAGIMLAYKTARENYNAKGNNRIILATDGDFNVGISSDGELTRLIEKEREDGVFLSVLGFGTGNYQDGKMEQLADKGNGNYAYIDNILEAKKVLVKEMGGTLLTIAKDVKLQIEFNPAKVKGYRLVGYENRLLNKEDFNDDKKDAGELGSGHTVTAIYEIIPAGSEELVASTDALKYQETKPNSAATSSEVMTIKFRYKEPKEKTSKLITHIVSDQKTGFDASSENCRFSVAVAEFGMLLRDSKFKGDADFKSVMTLAKSAKGADEEGYRAEFIKLVEIAELLKK